MFSIMLIWPTNYKGMINFVVFSQNFLKCIKDLSISTAYRRIHLLSKIFSRKNFIFAEVQKKEIEKIFFDFF